MQSHFAVLRLPSSRAYFLPHASERAVQRIGCAVLAGFIVAIAEAGLYLIWTNRASARKPTPMRRSKKVEPPIVALDIPEPILDTPDTPEGGLRRRTAVQADSINSPPRT